MAKEKDFKVDFIGVGIQRSGTTWISKCLAEHPEICFSEPKETHFFDILINQGKDIDHYKTFFSECDTESKILGEFTTSYFTSESIIQLIKKYFPDTKIIVSLRNPIDRAFSQYLYRKRKTGKHRDFMSVIKNNEADIVSCGYYYTHIQNILKYFDRKNVLVVIHDDHKRNPKSFIQTIYRFVGVDEGFIPTALHKQTNRTKDLQYRIPQLRWMFAGKRFTLKKNKYAPYIIPVLKMLGVGHFVRFIERVNTIRGNHKEVEFVTDEERNRLVEIYKDEIQKLEDFLGRDLSSWRC